MTRNFVVVLLCSFVLISCGSSRENLPETVPLGASLGDGSSPLGPGAEPAGGTTLAEALRQRSAARGGAPNEILVISGGGQNGAFGAGFLKGWLETGNRPQFDLVTGVSTGALSAPFAFLGTPADDAVIDELYLSLEADDVYSKRFMLAVLFSDSVLDNSALAEGVIGKHVTEDLIERVAKAYDEGRRLLVQTTCMDDGQVWVWDMTLIAKEMGVAGLPLFRQVMLASASVPIAFPPQFIEGWMHCDGSVRHDILMADLFARVDGGREATETRLDRTGGHSANVYIIVNSQLGLKTKPTEDGLMSIGGRAVEVGMDAALEASLFRSWAMSRYFNINLGMVWIPDDVDTGDNALAFDQKAMHAEFDRGRSMAKQAASWQKHPPLPASVLRRVAARDRIRQP